MNITDRTSLIRQLVINEMNLLNRVTSAEYEQEVTCGKRVKDMVRCGVFSKHMSDFGADANDRKVTISFVRAYRKENY